ncbi:hypothetical protein HK098_002297 [Nowakowskiella sp. JEL0407]|nr:hypothetical protein HK098_002297 [Nowakowskiella sp. JEL0407]
MSHSAFLQLRFPNGNCIKRGSIAKALVLLHVSSGPLSGENGLILEFHGNVSAAWEERGKDTTISDEIEDMFADEVVQLPRENPLSLSKAFFTQKIQVLRQSLWHSGNYEYNVEIPIPNDLPFTFTSTWPATHSQSTINASITYSCSVYIPSTSSFISDLKSNTVKLLISPILPTKSIPPTIQRPISSNSSIPVLFSGKININTSLSRGFIVFGERSRPIESSVPFSVTATVQNNSNHTINSININLVEKVSLQAQNNQTNFSTVLSTWNFSGCDPGASLLLENIYVDIPNSGAPSTFIWPDNSTLQTPSHAKCNPITPNVVNSVVSIRHEIQIQCNFPWYLFTKCIASTAIMVVSDAGPTPYFDDSVVIPSTSSSSAFQTPDEELKLDNEEWELIDNETPFDARPIDFGKVYEGSIGFQERRMYLFELSENVRSSSLHHSIGVKLVSDSDAGLRVSKGSLPGWWKYENKEESRIALHGKKDEVHEQEYVCSFNSGYGQYFIAVYGNQFSRETNYKITITGIQRISDADRDRFLVSENWSVVTPGVNSEFAKIPEHAWAVGNDFDGSPYYVARAWVEGGLQIGKIGINMETACISYGGREVFVTDQFEVLCLPSTTLTYQTTILPFEGIRWVEVLGPSSIPTNAIAFGHESDGSQLFLARVSFSSSVPFSNHKTLIPGKAGYHLRGAHVAYAGYEKVIERFECLVYDEPLGYVDTIKQNVKGKRRAF